MELKHRLAATMLLLLLANFSRRVASWSSAATTTMTTTTLASRRSLVPTTRLCAAAGSAFDDAEGRRMRRRTAFAQEETEAEEEETEDSGWENFDPTQEQRQQQPARRTRRAAPPSNSWMDDDDDDNYDDDDWVDRRGPPRSPGAGKPRRSYNNDMNNRSRDRRGDDRYNNNNNYNNRNNRRDDRFNSRGGGTRGAAARRGARDNKGGGGAAAEDRRINLKALEKAGFEHLYGLSPVLNALEAGRRELRRPGDDVPMDPAAELLLAPDELQEHERQQRQRPRRKPEAQFRPWLLVQEPKGGHRHRAADKAAQAARVLELAERRGVPVAAVDKGVLNVFSGDRPHQGCVLRCGRLFFESVSRLPLPAADDPSAAPSFWLVLDEVVDPQNFGALVRSAYFLGKDIGILTCRKNSAPPSPVTSAASAGVLERAPVFATSNLPRTLARAEQDGFRIVGAAASVPRDAVGVPLYDLQDLPVNTGGGGGGADDRDSARPTLLVLGSEGHGLRSLVARSCTEFVRIPSANREGVDSLNVSVTGGILLWHFLSQQLKDNR